MYIKIKVSRTTDDTKVKWCHLFINHIVFVGAIEDGSAGNAKSFIAMSNGSAMTSPETPESIENKILLILNGFV